MIIGTLDTFQRYIPLHPRFEKVALYLKQTNLAALHSGHYEVDKDEVFVNIDTYVTQPSKKIEAHRRYIDIQIILSGKETMGWIPLSYTQPSIAYNENKDILFVQGAPSTLIAQPGYFFIFFPEDAHQPGLCVQGPQPITKAVFKVLL